jgi:hypothetical protein
MTHSQWLLGLGARRATLTWWLRVVLGSLPPPASFALTWTYGEHAAITFASQPGMKVVDGIDHPKESTKNEHCSDSDDIV